MTIIGTEEEIRELKHQCDGRCTEEEFCLFGFQKDVCPVDCDGCLVFENSTTRCGQKFSMLNVR